MRRRGAVLGRGCRRRPARAAPQPLRRPDAARRRHGHAAGRGPGRADAAADDAAHARRDVACPVDVVYTWVDGDDPDWYAASSNGSRPGRPGPGPRRRARRAAAPGSESRDELRYSLRSLHLFAPWVRTSTSSPTRRCPPWLDASTTRRSQVVDHRDILPAEALPTFNSHAIETALHRIPGLAEHFVYFNDDVLPRPAGRPRAVLRRRGPVRGLHVAATSSVSATRTAQPAYITAALRNRWLLEEAFGVAITHHLVHAPYPQRVSVLAEVADRFATEVGATAHAPFRSETDVSMVSSLAPHYGLMTGSAYEASLENSFVDLATTNVGLVLENVLQRQQDAVCLGDHHDYAMEMAAGGPPGGGLLRALPADRRRRGSARDYRRRRRPTSRWKAGCQLGRASPPVDWRASCVRDRSSLVLSSSIRACFWSSLRAHLAAYGDQLRRALVLRHRRGEGVEVDVLLAQPLELGAPRRRRGGARPGR